MALGLNQFNITPIVGMVDMNIPGNTLSCGVSANQATALVPGQPVKLDSTITTPGLPQIVAATSNQDNILGFVSYNPKDQGYGGSYPSRVLEVAIRGAVIYMNSGGAINPGQRVEFDYANPGNVVAAAGINSVCGFALDGCSASNTLIRVVVEPPIGSNSNNLRTLNVTATLAQINAGLVLIPGVTGQSIIVSDVSARVTGNFATGTSVILQSTNASPVAVYTMAEAGLTTGAVLIPGSANTTLGAGWSAPLGSGDGLKLVNNGSAQTGGTNIQFLLTYQQY